MAEPGAHLKPEVRALLERSDQERLQFMELQPSVGYTRVREILGRLEGLFSAPQQPRMRNMLIIGESNNGKSTILEEFRMRHPAVENLEGEGVDVPVLCVEVPPVPDENRLYIGILDELFAPYRSSDHVSKKRKVVVDLLPRLNVKMLMLDEVHNLLGSSVTKRQGFLNTIRHLGNVLRIPIVAAGMAEAARALFTDPQLANRFHPEPLPLWTLNVEYLRMLKSLEERIPLKNPSNIYKDQKLASRVLGLSEGILGEVVELMRQAAKFAIDSGREQIDAKALAEVDFEPPSVRRRMVERYR